MSIRLLPLLILSAGGYLLNPAAAQTGKPDAWPPFCREVEIPSTLDGAMQKAYVYWTGNEDPRPLVVSLHTWSGDYAQTDSLAWICRERDFHYIHPDFRGANTRPEACGSPLVIRDIEDAISYALEHADVEPGEIHVIGSSGGGYATLLTYMKTDHPVKSFSAWVPISDLSIWYHESEARGTKYAFDLALCTNPPGTVSRDHYFLGEEEAVRRSPIHMTTPVEKRSDSRIRIFAGIHDGYTGSVPITHSLFFYNKVVADFESAKGGKRGPNGAATRSVKANRPRGLEKSSGRNDQLIPPDEIIEMVSSRNFKRKPGKELEGRTVHYYRNYDNLVEITIFEGGHEMLSEAALFK